MIRLQQKIDYDTDVAIVGGGPGGSSLAYHLASSGIRTTVIDAARFPRDKVCGDGVSPIALSELDAIGITRLTNFKKANSIDQVGLFMEGDKTLIQLEKPEGLRFHARIIPRKELDYMIYSNAKKSGARYIEESRVVDYTVFPNKVVTFLKNGTGTTQLTSKLLVGADGSRSVVGRKLRGAMTDQAYQLIGLRKYYEGVNGPGNRVDVYFSKESFPGIFWIFPRGKSGANIGMAMTYHTCPEEASDLRRDFTAQLAGNPVMQERIGQGRPTEKVQGWPITFYDKRNPLVGDRVLLVGEAAGLINPLSGDGIQYAVLSARWAAGAIRDCLRSNDISAVALGAYKDHLGKELEYDFSLSNLLVQFGRNKTLVPIWITILQLLISRCKEDPKFAATLAGIFEGTYPSYKALSPEFISKILWQAGTDAQGYLLKGCMQPLVLAQDGLRLGELAGEILQEIQKNPMAHFQWICDVTGKTLDVAMHTAKHVFKK